MEGYQKKIEKRYFVLVMEMILKVCLLWHKIDPNRCMCIVRLAKVLLSFVYLVINISCELSPPNIKRVVHSSSECFKENDSSLKFLVQ